jgi:NAD(P)-dependent dehydrogenase (short-subunit alcohol dehydrogenase family)
LLALLLLVPRLSDNLHCYSMVIPIYDGSHVVEPGASFDPGNLQGKSVLVTGGASGMGENMVRAFTAAGAWVAFGDIQEERGRHVASETGAHFVQGDVSVWVDQAKLFKEAIENSPTKTVDVVVANAGHSGRDPIYWDGELCESAICQPDLGVQQTVRLMVNLSSLICGS